MGWAKTVQPITNPDQISQVSFSSLAGFKAEIIYFVYSLVYCKLETIKPLQPILAHWCVARA